jgi:hypothetical protein
MADPIEGKTIKKSVNKISAISTLLVIQGFGNKTTIRNIINPDINPIHLTHSPELLFLKSFMSF